MLIRLCFLVLGLTAVSACTAQDLGAKYVVGQNYFLIEPPQPTSAGDKVEVIEVFSYKCSHCASFQPYADQLRKGLPAGASFSYMPAMFQPGWDVFARGFYTAETLGKLEQTHQAMYDALWRDQKPYRSIEDLAEFYSGHGIKTEDFMGASTSFAVETKLRRAAALVPKYQIDGTPTVVVNGKYRVTGQSAGGYTQLMDLVNYLVNKEIAAKPKAN